MHEGKDRSSCGEYLNGTMADESCEVNNIMQVEVAILRELAYRRKVGMMQLQPHDSIKQLIPSEVQSSSSELSPAPYPSPSHSLSGTKRQAPIQQPEPLFGIQAHERPRDSCFCSLCQVHCSSAVDFKQHMRGQKHRARLQDLKSGRRDFSEVYEAVSQRKWCDICRIWCTSAYSLKQHLDGQKHKSRVQKLQCTMKCGGGMAEQRRFCRLCNIWCSNEYTLQTHLKGKPHLDQLSVVKQRNRFVNT